MDKMWEWKYWFDTTFRKYIFTCNKCQRQDICDYAWDEYNKDGDCLWEK